MNFINKLKRYYKSNKKGSYIEDSRNDTIGLSGLVQDKIDKQLKVIKNRGIELSKRGYSKLEIDRMLQDEFGSGKDPIYRWQLGDCILGNSTKEFLKDEGIKLFDHKYCPDCYNRANEKGTLEFWTIVGKPKSKFSVCREGCTCTLIKIAK